MSKKPVTKKAEAEKAVKDIRRATRKVHSAEEKIRIVLAGLRGEDNEPCRAIDPIGRFVRRITLRGNFPRTFALWCCF